MGDHVRERNYSKRGRSGFMCVGEISLTRCDEHSSEIRITEKAGNFLSN
jgi:hypothetical protein